MKYLTTLMTVVLVLLMIGAGAQAQQEEARIPNMIIEPLGVYPVGGRVTFTVMMQNDEGRRLPNLPLVVFLDGERVRRIRTDEAGLANVSISSDMEVGTHIVSVEFIGTTAYRAIKTKLPLTIRPVDLTIQTVPALPDMPFVIDGATYTSDESGAVRVSFQQTGTYNVQALPLPDDVVDDNTLASFQRWSDAVFDPERTVDLRSDEYIEAGYIVSHPASQSFIDLDGQAVAQSRIETLTLKSSTGDLYTFEDGSTRWLQATRINRNRDGLAVTPILYSVESVNIDGANVVNKYQQRFYVEPQTPDWQIELLMYHARIWATDALFGFRVGDGITLEYPNGELEHIPYTEDNDVVIGPMARGTYRVKPTGVEGMAPFTPVALSRDQEAELKVLTVFDMALSAGLGVVGALGLLIYGRPHLLRLPFMLFSRIQRLGRANGQSMATTSTVSSPGATFAEETAYASEVAYRDEAVYPEETYIAEAAIADQMAYAEETYADETAYAEEGMSSDETAYVADEVAYPQETYVDETEYVEEGMSSNGTAYIADEIAYSEETYVDETAYAEEEMSSNGTAYVADEAAYPEETYIDEAAIADQMTYAEETHVDETAYTADEASASSDETAYVADEVAYDEETVLLPEPAPVARKKKRIIRVRSLSHDETQTLNHLGQLTSYAIIMKRCNMILLSHEGLTSPKIGNEVGYSGQTVRRYIKRYNNEGVRGLFNRTSRGQDAEISSDYLQLLEQTLSQRPEDLGLPYTEWTVENVAIYLAGKTGFLADEDQIREYFEILWED